MSEMRKHFMKGASLSAVVIAALVGCASPQPQLGPQPDKLAPLSPASPHEAVAVIYRGMDASAEPALVMVNDRLVGSLKPGSYTQTRICPGDSLGVVSASAAARQKPVYQTIAGTPGSTVYLQVEPTPSAGGWRAMPVDTQSAQQKLAGDQMGTYLVPRYTPQCNPPPVVAAPAPAPVVVPAPAPAAPPVVLERVQLQADALFAFGRSEAQDITPAGRKALDQLVQDIRNRGVRVQLLRITGHADRLGAAASNQQLSKARALTVQQYLQRGGLNLPMESQGRGSAEPVSQGCKGNRATPALIACLQPDRRVSIDLLGQQASGGASR